MQVCSRFLVRPRWEVLIAILIVIAIILQKNYTKIYKGLHSFSDTVSDERESVSKTRDKSGFSIHSDYKLSVSACSVHQDDWKTVHCQKYNFHRVPTNKLEKNETANRNRIQKQQKKKQVKSDDLLDECEHYKVKLEENCDSDCQEFRQLLLTWPSNKPKSAIYSLIQFKLLDELKITFNLLAENFNNEFNYPIILFTDEDEMKNKTVRNEIRSWTKATIYFQHVHMEIPRHVNRNMVPDTYCRAPIGYRNMCRFHSKQVYEQQVLVGLDYVLRLDHDSYINKPIRYDLFKFMQINGMQYGYVLARKDAWSCVRGLWQSTCKFAKNELGSEKFISGNNLFNNGSFLYYFNNFEVSSLSLWRSCQYQKYIDYIDRQGGTYYLRWGDSPIKSLAVCLLVPESKVHTFTDIAYYHHPLTSDGIPNYQPHLN